MKKEDLRKDGINHFGYEFITCSVVLRVKSAIRTLPHYCFMSWVSDVCPRDDWSADLHGP